MYRMGTWLIALAFVFNGVAMTAWNGPAKAPAAVTQIHYADADSADCNGVPDAAAIVVTHFDRTHSRVHNHLKCCGTCTVASLVPDVAAVPVVFNCKSTTFRTAQNHLVGHLLFLDPDIPKFVG